MLKALEVFLLLFRLLHHIAFVLTMLSVLKRVSILECKCLIDCQLALLCIECFCYVLKFFHCIVCVLRLVLL
jgi:hypothetical protein